MSKIPLKYLCYNSGKSQWIQLPLHYAEWFKIFVIIFHFRWVEDVSTSVEISARPFFAGCFFFS